METGSFHVLISSSEPSSSVDANGSMGPGVTGTADAAVVQADSVYISSSRLARGVPADLERNVPPRDTARGHPLSHPIGRTTRRHPHRSRVAHPHHATRWLDHPDVLQNLGHVVRPHSFHFRFPVHMSPASYLPRRFASGTFPVSRNYHLRQMLYNYACSGDRDNSSRDLSDQVIPSFPFSDVPVYADTVDIETLAFHDFWGCLLTPDNVAARICTQDLRYHVWVASKRVVESGRIPLGDEEALIRGVIDQFMIELGLVVLDLCPGPLLLFVDPRLHDDAAQMVVRATAMVAKFDEAQVRRWRIIVTLPATEEGIRAARELVDQHGIQTNLSLVSCLEHAAACVEAGASMVSMSVEPILEWFEQRGWTRGGCISQDHPGIEAIQSCATFLHRRGLNTKLLTTDVRKWSELKQLGGIGATALTKDQLDQIPMKQLTTWYPRQDDESPATLRALQAEYPSRYLDSNKGFLVSLPAECRSVAPAVLYVRLGKMVAHMETIEKVVWHELKQRIRLETIPLEYLYRRRPFYLTGLVADTDARSSRSRFASSSSSRSKSRSKSTCRHRSRSEEEHEQPQKASAVRIPDTMIEGIDYF